MSKNSNIYNILYGTNKIIENVQLQFECKNMEKKVIKPARGLVNRGMSIRLVVGRPELESLAESSDQYTLKVGIHNFPAFQHLKGIVWR